MGHACKICTHANRLEIDREIVRGMNKTQISRVFDVPHDSVHNHARNHLSRQLLKSEEMPTLTRSKSLVEEISNLIARTKPILHNAETRELRMVSLKAISELRQTYGFMVSTAFLLRQKDREAKVAKRRKGLTISRHASTRRNLR